MYYSRTPHIQAVWDQGVSVTMNLPVTMKPYDSLDLYNNEGRKYVIRSSLHLYTTYQAGL